MSICEGILYAGGDKMGFLKDIKDKMLIYDGSKGFMLQLAGLPSGESPESFNASYPDIVFDLHKAYVEAGCDVIQTNTFTGNRIMLEKHGFGDSVKELNKKGAEIAKKAAENKAYVAASIGPTGILFEPYGELTFDMAYEIFKEQIEAVAEGGVDIINFETFTDISEMKVALLAAKENCSLPVICSMAFEQNRRTLMGTDPASCCRILKSAGADLVGANCSFGPSHMLNIIKAMAVTGEYLSVKPNAGLPRVEDGKTVYDQCPVDFVNELEEYFKLNVRLIGGCCGTTPEYISELINRSELIEYEGDIDKRSYLCSSTNSIPVEEIVNIGKIIITFEFDEDDIDDEIQELAYSEIDAIELEYSGNELNRIKSIVNRNLPSLKKPLILSGRNIEAIVNVLRIYPGIAGIRADIKNNYGAVKI